MVTPTCPTCSFRYAKNGNATMSPEQYAIKHIPCKFLNSGTSAYTKKVVSRNGTDNSRPAKNKHCSAI